MAETPRSSFIPKQTTSAVSSRTHKKKRFNMLGLISTVLLLSSLVLTGGTYFYKDYATKQLEEEKNALSEERNRFNESDIASIRELDQKFKAANYIIDQHIAPSKIFDTLELTTQDRIQFTAFSLEYDPTKDIHMTVEGATEEFRTVALQEIQFDDDQLMAGVIFGDLTSEVNSVENIRENIDSNEERVGFSVSGTMRAAQLSYDGVATQPVDETETTDTENILEESETDATDESNGAADVNIDE